MGYLFNPCFKQIPIFKNMKKYEISNYRFLLTAERVNSSLEVILEKSSEIFSCDRANERTVFFRKNLRQKTREVA